MTTPNEELRARRIADAEAAMQACYMSHADNQLTTTLLHDMATAAVAALARQEEGREAVDPHCEACCGTGRANRFRVFRNRLVELRAHYALTAPGPAGGVDAEKVCAPTLTETTFEQWYASTDARFWNNWDACNAAFTAGRNSANPQPPSAAPAAVHGAPRPRPTQARAASTASHRRSRP